MRWLQPPAHAVGVEVVAEDLDHSASALLYEWGREHDLEIRRYGPRGTADYGFICGLGNLWPLFDELDSKGIRLASISTLGHYAPGDPRHDLHNREANSRGVTIDWVI